MIFATFGSIIGQLTARERYQGDGAIRKIWFESKCPVAGDRNIEPGAFRSLHQFAILHTTPSHVRDGKRLMMRKEGPQVMRNVLIQ